MGGGSHELDQRFIIRWHTPHIVNDFTKRSFVHLTIIICTTKDMMGLALFYSIIDEDNISLNNRLTHNRTVEAH